MIRFPYRVIDADKAKTLNDKKVEPSLIDPQAGVQLVVRRWNKSGQLRQSSTRRQANLTGWRSEQGRLVKRGDRVNVAIGHFRADGLVVD